MPRARKIRRWTPVELKQLRRAAGRQTIAAISRLLKRSPAAIRFKAHMERISLARR